MKLTQEMTEVRSKLRKQMNNLKSLDEKVSSLTGIQVELKAYIDGVETRADGNMNKVAEVLRKQDEFSQRLAKVENVGTGVH
jgi:predicted RNase H-like nuclease (RuvC/YqgF family)